MYQPLLNPSSHATMRIILPFTAIVLVFYSCSSSEESSRPELVSLIKKHVVEIATVEPCSGTEDLQFIKQVLKDKRIVAVGEAAHGASEFFKMKHRLFEFLVTEMGFTIFAIEANFSEALKVNDFVLYGKGGPLQAVKGLYFWTWDTREVLDLILWMRQYNLDQTHKQKIKFYGFDMQASRQGALAVLQYLKKVDEAFYKKARLILSPYLAHRSIAYDKNITAKEIEDASKIYSVKEHIRVYKKEYIEHTSANEYALAVQHLETVIQCFELGKSISWLQWKKREIPMADNVEWILNHEGSKSKMMIWAHNAHVSSDNVYYFTGAMGKHLKKRFANTYYAIGWEFNNGSIRAKQKIADGSYQITDSIRVQEPYPGTVSDLFSKAKKPVLFIDLNEVEKHPSNRLNIYFNTSRPMTYIGAVYNPGDNRYTNKNLQECFDGLLFIETINPAKGN